MTRVLVGWLVLTALGSVWTHEATRIHPMPMPHASAQRWALGALETSTQARTTLAPPSEAARYHAAGAVVSLAWLDGRVRARHVGTTSLVDSVLAAQSHFRTALPASDRPDAHDRYRFTLSIPLGEGPLVRGVPYLSTLGVVPLHEGVIARLGEAQAIVTPDELWAEQVFDRAVVTPIPDLSFGMDVDAVVAGLARELGVEPDVFERGGEARRFRAGQIARDAYPGRAAVSAASLERAAALGARFLLRHQEPNGRFVYLYDGHANAPAGRGAYSLPRHAGSTAFLALAARMLDLPEAREGALRALRWTRRHATQTCGAPDRLCVVESDRRVANVGSAALTALAATELLVAEDEPLARSLLEGTLAFIRAMQRPDGELMHDYDRVAGRPVDVQHMYYSGEAAYALLKAHRILRDDRDLERARRLLTHLTGAAWSFFGSRYFYGEEHWTCQAVAEAADRLDVDEGLDFCLRWLAFQRALQYEPGGTPWLSEGAMGVGPLLVPRITPPASRVEAGAQIYRVARARGMDTASLRRQLERGVALLLRLQWTPGPAHLLRDPEAALGAIPETQASLRARNDFVQHAGNAMLHWAQVLRESAR